MPEVAPTAVRPSPTRAFLSVPESGVPAVTETVRRSPRRLTFLVLAAGAGSFSMLQSLITPVLPTIQHDLHTSQNTVTWVLTAYLLSASIFTPILGRVGDMVGKERMLVVALAALSLGCLLAAVAPSIGVLIVARVVQGVGGAVFPLSFGIIRDEFPAARVFSAVATISAIVAAGGGLGVVLAGPIVTALDYRWLFWIPMVVVGLTAVAAHLFVPESPVRTPGRIDWRATLLLSGWLVALLYGASMFSVYAFLPQFVQTPTVAGYGFGATISQAGLLMLPMLVAMFVAGLLAGRLESRFNAKAQLATGAAFNLLASAMLTEMHDTRWEIGIAGGLVGLGIGLAFASMANLIVGSVPARQTGVATGMNANIRTIGGAIGAAVVSGVITAHPQANGLPRESGFTLGFLVLTGLALTAVLAALAVPSPRRAVAGRRPSPVPDPVGELLTVPAGR
jgi:MFS family permease